MKLTTVGALENDNTRELASMICPQCLHHFRLEYDPMSLRPSLSINFDEDEPETGIYGVQIQCPNCHYEEEL